MNRLFSFILILLLSYSGYSQNSNNQFKATAMPRSHNLTTSNAYALSTLNNNLAFYSKNYNQIFKPNMQAFNNWSADFYDYFKKDVGNVYAQSYYTNYTITGFTQAGPDLDAFYGRDLNAAAVGAGMLTGIITAVFNKK